MWGDLFYFLFHGRCFVEGRSLTFLSCRQVLSHQVSDEHLPDVSLIGEMEDVTEMGKLVQLVLGCAVSCEKKQGKENKHTLSSCKN